MNTKSNIFDLTGKRALVTGSSQGIGFMLAKGLAEAGAEVVLNGRDTAKLDAAAAELTALGATVYQLPFDATDRATGIFAASTPASSAS